ncbi:hypothetical protein EXS54_02945 [Patescibacteria group bacterium]|nr:hypothetical protein [Patescibacteria group bacterium]
MQGIKRTFYRLGGSALVVATSAQTAMAQQKPDVPNPVGADNLGNVLFNVVNALLLFAGAVAVLFLIIGGFRYVVSTGNETQVAGAKNTILYAVLGLIIIFIAFVLVTLVQSYLGVNAKYTVSD